MKRQHPDNENLFWCPACKTYQEKSQYYEYPQKKHGINSTCKKCCSARNKKWKLKNKERVRELNAQWRENHPRGRKKRVVLSEEERRERKRKQKREQEKKRRLKPHVKIKLKEKRKRAYEIRKHTEEYKEHKKKYKKKEIDDLSYSYVKYSIMSRVKNPSDDEVNLVRIRIEMKRTLKKFKEWRKSNEPNHTNVYGKQCENEKNHEGRV